METKEYKLLDGRTIRAKYDRLGMCKISQENLESFVKEFDTSYRQAKILEKIKENYALMKLEERKVGKWLEVWESQRDEFSGEYDEWREHKCSICDFQEMDADRFNFCPNCGAKMVGAENE